MRQTIIADAKHIPLPDECVQTTCTSPPYFRQRTYLPDDSPSKHLEVGLEQSPEKYVEGLVSVFQEVRRVLKRDGTLWLNIDDSASTKIDGDIKPKDLIGIPWMLAFALRADGWYLRSAIIWLKTNPRPESITDRPSHIYEHVFLLAKSRRYYYDADAIREPYAESTIARMAQHTLDDQTGGDKSNMRDSIAPGRKRRDRRPVDILRGLRDGELKGANKKDVWAIPTAGISEAHFAAFPTKLVEPMVLAGSKVGDLVLDPFAGSGTVGIVAIAHNRRFVGLDLNPAFARMSRRRTHGTQIKLF